MALLVYYVTNIIGCIKSFDRAAIDVGCEQAQVGLLRLFRGNAQ